MDILKNHILQLASLNNTNKIGIRVGKVKTYNPVDYTCTVILLPDDVETGRMPIYSFFAGDGYGMFAGPSENDLCTVFFIEGEANYGFVLCYGFGGDKRPLNTPSGEFIVKHKSGSYVQEANDGKVNINSDTQIHIGDLENTVKRLVNEEFKTIYNTHTHASDGEPPTQLMTDAELTDILRGN